MIYKLKGWFCNVILIWLTVLLYKTINYYQKTLTAETQTIIFYLALTYTILGLIYYLLTASTKLNKTTGEIFFEFINKFFGTITSSKLLKPDKKEKTIMLFLAVKIFFLPLMLNFTINNYHSIKNQLPNLSLSALTIQGFNDILFPLLISLIFFLDTFYFSVGYSVESKYLKNKIRSVEPTILGWVVALACYPPFNTHVVKYLNWYANDYNFFASDISTFILRLSVVFFLTIYVSASVALGGKCSNLTNRGIVSRGPYSIIRHPAYIAKNLAWWLTIIPIASLPAILSMSAWTLIYHLRTLTEERHLKQDPDYLEYCKKVKYKYIPWVY